MLGSETKIKDILKGLNQSLLRNINYKFQLFGHEKNIKKYIEKYKRLLKSSEIIDCDSHISMNDKPTEILKAKENSSMFLAIKSVKENFSDAVLSFGNTGALMSLSLLNIKTLKYIKRPAIASIWPNINGESIVLDLGANTKLDSRYLIDNSILGSSLASILFKIDKPSIGLLNVGIEDNKGKDEIKRASNMLKDLSKNSKINYYGYVEGNDISIGKTNVVVTDGFTGNIALKTAEGTSNFIISELKKALSSSLIGKLSSLLNYNNLKKFKNKLDPRLYNGAILLGLDKPVIKSHGSTDSIGFANSLNVCEKIIRGNLIDQIKKNIN